MNKKHPFSHPFFGQQEEVSTGNQARQGQRANEAYAAQNPDLNGFLDDLPQAEPGPASSGGGMFIGQPDHDHPGSESPAVDIDDETLAAMCRMRVCPDCPVKKEADDANLRALAEIDNARKRLAREKEDQVRFASESVMNDIIPSLDNLDLALKHAGQDTANNDFVTGVRMTRNLMVEALKKHGLQEVGEIGQEFDPAKHEAVGMAPSEEIPEGHVCSLLSHGYTLNGRLLRPAMVVVCKNG